jgi:DNA-binding response OmpR family regulator
MAKRILVLDDEEELLELICAVLADAGYETIGISSPDAVDGALGKSHPQLFLVDIMLKGQSGIDVARALRGEGYPRTPMIAMSASPSMAGYARSSGVFAETLDKPFDITYLLEIVERHLRATG